MNPKENRKVGITPKEFKPQSKKGGSGPRLSFLKIFAFFSMKCT
jgi:hypothetical protein